MLQCLPQEGSTDIRKVEDPHIKVAVIGNKSMLSFLTLLLPFQKPPRDMIPCPTNTAVF